MGFNRLNCVLLGFIGFYWVLLGLNGITVAILGRARVANIPSARIRWPSVFVVVDVVGDECPVARTVGV